MPWKRAFLSRDCPGLSVQTTVARGGPLAERVVELRYRTHLAVCESRLIYVFFQIKVDMITLRNYIHIIFVPKIIMLK